jgi:hypothetical protein
MTDPYLVAAHLLQENRTETDRRRVDETSARIAAELVGRVRAALRRLRVAGRPQPASRQPDCTQTVAYLPEFH